jgi:hypothetical protein
MWQWIVQNKELLFGGAVGTALVGAVGFLLKKLFESRTPVPAPAQQISQAPQSSQAPQIVVAPTFNNLVGQMVPEQKSPPESKHVAPPEPSHNVSYLGPKIVNLLPQRYRSEDHVFITPQRTKFQGAVVTFRNNAELNRVRTVRAQAFLRFFGKDSKEIGEGVSGACWLTEEGNFPGFELIPGGPSGTLLTLMTDGKHFVVPYRRTVNAHWGQGHVADSTNFDQLPPYIEVSILDSSRKKVLPSITISLAFENGELRVSTES